jgi:hypothetical protein
MKGQQQMLKFELSQEMVAVIGRALGAQPFDIVAPVVAELQKQITAQQQSSSAGPIINGQTVEESSKRKAHNIPAN